MPRTKASAKRATGEDDEAKEDSGPKEDAPTAKNDAPTPSKMKKKKKTLVKKSSTDGALTGKEDDFDDKKKRKRRDAKDKDDGKERTPTKERDEEEDEGMKTTKRAKANKERALKRSLEMTKKMKEKQEKEKTKETPGEKDDGGKKDEEKKKETEAEAKTETEKGEKEKKKSSNTVNVGRKSPASKGGGRAKRGAAAKLELAKVEEAPIVKVPSSVPQLMELKQIMEREMLEHEEASASMRAAELERSAALKALDEANKKAEFSGSHLNRVARRMKQTARKVAAQSVNAQMLEQTMITKTVKNWAKSKDERMKEARDICMSIMTEWIELVRNTAHLMQQQQEQPQQKTVAEIPINMNANNVEEKEENLDAAVKKESAREEDDKTATKEAEEKDKVEKEEEKPLGIPPSKITTGGIKVEPNLPGPLADIYKKSAPGASKILEDAKKKTAAMHSIVPKEPNHSSVRMKVLSYLQKTFNLSKDAALTCEAALFNAKANVGLDYKLTLKKLSEDGVQTLKSGSANLDVGKVPPGLTLFMQQTKSLQAKKKKKRTPTKNIK